MQQSTNTSAVVSLVLGILALVTLVTVGIGVGCLPVPLILGIVAWVLGKNALSLIEAGLGNPGDRGIAMTGYVLGILTVALSVLGLCCLVGAVGILGIGLLPIWQDASWGL